MISSLYVHSAADAKPLRIGVLVDGLELLRVFRQVLTNIAACDFARLELVVVNQQPASVPTVGTASKLTKYLRVLRDSQRRSHILYTLYDKADQKHRLQPDPLELVDCADLLASLPRLDVAPVTRKFVHRFPPEAIARLRDYDLDVLLRFGFNILRGEVLTSARYGIWSFHHGDNEFYRGGPAMLWEIIEDNPCSGVILQVLTEKLDDGLVLCKSRFATERGLWRSRNVFNPYWGSSHFIIRKLHQLHERGWESLQKQAVPPAPYRGKTAIYRSPVNSQMVKWLAPKIAGKLLRRPFQRATAYHWRICLRRTDSPRLLTDLASRWSEYRWLPSPKGHFYGDPFLLRRRGQTWLFFEDYSYSEKRGRIVCAPIHSDLSIDTPAPCLELPYHLSYPCVFEHDGEVFMIPESGSNETVQLYRATEFPLAWKLEKILYRGRAVDTTPLQHDGRWYFFTALSEPPGNAAFGALFSAQELTADWKLHPGSPISTDVRTARSAGPIQVVGDRLLRPVQDCSQNYGGRILVQQIVSLSPCSYDQRQLHSIEANWEPGLEGVHTYGFCAGIEVLDAVKRERLAGG